MLEKFKSRKFILALIAQIVGLIALFVPEYQTEVGEAAGNLGALLLMALTGAGYIKAEASIDAESVKAEAGTPLLTDSIDLEEALKKTRELKGDPDSPL